MRAKRIVWQGGLIVFMALLIIGVGCRGSRSVTGQAPDVDISGPWAFTSDGAGITSCTTEALNDQFEEGELPDFQVVVTQAGSSVSGTGNTVPEPGLPVSFDGTLTQSTVAGTRASITADLTIEGINAAFDGPVTNILGTFDGGIDDTNAILTLGIFWDKDAYEANGDEIATFCADADTEACTVEEFPVPEPFDDAGEVFELSICDSWDDWNAAVSAGAAEDNEAFNYCQTEGLSGSCSETGEGCVRACTDDPARACSEDADCVEDFGPCNIAEGETEGFCEGTEDACTTDDDCIDSFGTCSDSCPSLGGCIEATCNFTGRYLSDRSATNLPE